MRLLAAALLDGTSRIADLPETALALDLPEHGRYVVVAVAGGFAACPGAQAALAPGVRVHWHTVGARPRPRPSSGSRSRPRNRTLATPARRMRRSCLGSADRCGVPAAAPAAAP
ncbi:hypothetical protein SHIRM173S_02368 [Streptomyces hirsutus]